MTHFSFPSVAGFATLIVSTLPTHAAEPTSLKDAYGSMFEVGVAIPGPELNEAERNIVNAQFTHVTPENCMKPISLTTEEGDYNFDQADAFVKFAQDQGLKINGHCLVWENQCPDWFFADKGKPASRELVLKRMIDHITTVVGHFRGRVASWDVVNEAISDGDGPQYLNGSRWGKFIGEDYIAQAFSAAAKADPNAELYYNDYVIEQPSKRDKVIRLIRDLKKQNIRIDGVGIQGHWEIDKIPFKDLEDAIVALQKEGVKVMITELDLDMVFVPRGSADDPYRNGCPPEVLQKQADQYAELFAIFRKHSDAVTRVTFWGLQDGRSWLNYYPVGRTNYPLLWGRDLQPKPALEAILAESKKP